MKVDHHLTFLSSAIEDQTIPNGLKWNITVNVMDTNPEIEKVIKDHIKDSELKLLEAIRTHYDTLEATLCQKKEKLYETISTLETSENAGTALSL